MAPPDSRSGTPGATPADVVTATKVSKAIERGAKFGIVPILELEPVQTVVETFVDTATGREKRLTPQLITPFLGINRGTSVSPIDPPDMGIGFQGPDGLPVFRAIDGVKDPIQAWRALELLDRLTRTEHPLPIKNGTLYDLLQAGDRKKRSDDGSFGDLVSDLVGGKEAFALTRDEVVMQFPPIEELRIILNRLSNNGVVIDPTELKKAMAEGRIVLTDSTEDKDLAQLIDSMIADGEKATRAADEERQKHTGQTLFFG